MQLTKQQDSFILFAKANVSAHGAQMGAGMENRMEIYNSLTKKVEPFVPNEDGKVKMYTCGPTVYHFAHIGNLRSYIMEDLLEKTLRYLGYDVKRVMNITDVGHLSGDSGDGETAYQAS